MQEPKTVLSLRKGAMEHAPFLFILGIAAYLCVWHIAWSLPEIYEEAMPVRIAWKFWNWKNSGVQFHPSFFTYPAFVFYLNFGAESLVYQIGRLFGAYPNFAAFKAANADNLAAFVLLGRWINVLFSLATVVYTYRIAIRFASKEAGWLAALLMATSPLFISEAHLVNVDTPLMCFCVLTLWYAIGILDRGKLSDYLGAGIAAGLAAASKYNGAVAFALPLCAHLMREPDVKRVFASLGRPRIWISILAGVFVFALTNPYVILDFNTFWNQFTDVQIHMDAGHLGLDPGESGYAYYLFTTLPASLGWLTTLACFVAFTFALARRTKLVVLLWLLPVLMIGVMGAWKMHPDRYLLPVIPFVVIGAAATLAELWRQIFAARNSESSRGKFGNPAFQTIFAVAGAVILIVLPVKQVLAYHLSFSMPDTRVAARDWIANNVEPINFIVVGPNGPDLPEAQNVLRLPFNALETERTAAFYDMRWYGEAKYFILSDYDQGRYNSDPVRFKPFLDFYVQVKQRSSLIYSVVPDQYRRGPAITIYDAFADSTSDDFPDDLIQRLADVGNDGEVFLFCRRMGAILTDLRKVGKAYPLLEIAVAMRPEDLPARQVLSRVLCLTSKWDEAHRSMREYIAAHPDNVRAILYDGDVYANEGKMNEAEATYLDGLELDTTFVMSYQKLGALYFHERNAAKLRPLLLRYKSILDPKSADAQIVTRQLADLATWKTGK